MSDMRSGKTWQGGAEVWTRADKGKGPALDFGGGAIYKEGKACGPCPQGGAWDPKPPPGTDGVFCGFAVRLWAHHGHPRSPDDGLWGERGGGGGGAPGRPADGASWKPMLRSEWSNVNRPHEVGACGHRPTEVAPTVGGGWPMETGD